MILRKYLAEKSRMRSEKMRHDFSPVGLLLDVYSVVKVNTYEFKYFNTSEIDDTIKIFILMGSWGASDLSKILYYSFNVFEQKKYYVLKLLHPFQLLNFT